MFTSRFFNFAKRQLQQYSGTRQIHDVSKQIIKPSIPTPSHLKRYNLNSMDQFSRIVYMPIIFHYPNRDSNDSSSRAQDIAEKSRRLKTSLSETLNQYYPFAGRLGSTGSYIHCNDAGVEFQEVKFECGLSEILHKPDHEVREFFYPKEFHISDKKSTLVVVRLNHFECGGLSILVCVSHKLGDAGSLLIFANSWAIKTRNVPSDYAPHFLENPPTDTEVPEYPAAENDKGVIRKFVFPNSKIAQLKSMIPDSTRVEALTALIFKCVTAVNNVNLGSFTPHLLMTMVNMRQKLLQPLPETAVGNLYWPTYVLIRNEAESNLKALVEQIKRGKTETNGMKDLDATVYLAQLGEFLSQNYVPFGSSSICRMKFYQVDFGWGTPYRVTLATPIVNNAFVLMDAPEGDGIEALVSLDDHNMSALQKNEEIIAFTSCRGSSV